MQLPLTASIITVGALCYFGTTEGWEQMGVIVLWSLFIPLVFASLAVAAHEGKEK